MRNRDTIIIKETQKQTKVGIAEEKKVKTRLEGKATPEEKKIRSQRKSGKEEKERESIDRVKLKPSNPGSKKKSQQP